MIKKIIAVCGLLFSIMAYAQETNASPYSYYGIGDLKFKGTPDTRAMGGIGIFPDSIHVNLQNPASYSHLKVTTFSVAASNSNINFKSSGPDESANRTTLDYLALAIPFNNKFGMAFGIMPYTAVGYKIQNTVEGGDGIIRDRQFNGRGGINRVFLGGAYQVTPAFSVGADVSYNFGNIETKSIVSVSGVQLSTRETNDSHYGGVSLNVGATYKKTLSNKYDWITSATFTPASTLKSSIDREIATISITNNGEIVNDAETFSLSDEDVKMPARFTVGSGIGIKTKWFAGVEYAYQQSNELGNRFDNITSAGFEAGHRASVGGYYTPNYMSYSSYFSRVTYRGGFRFEKTGLVVNNNSINDYALTFGASLPLGAFIGSSSLNIGFEWGRRGTTSANLIQENYFNMLVSLSLNDRWFIKRKYD